MGGGVNETDRVKRRRESVVLVHGMFASRRSMLRLEAALSQAAYGVVNWGYRSLSDSIAAHAERLARFVETLDADGQIERLHFVTHSMGGIILRCALQLHTPARCGRIVLLAPPNRGSRLAALPLGPLRRVFPQAEDLSSQAGSLVSALPEPSGIDVGVIAASHDFVVEVAATHLACQRDHLVLPSSHQQLPSRPATARHVLAFLAAGSFRVCPQTRTAGPQRIAA